MLAGLAGVGLIAGVDGGSSAPNRPPELDNINAAATEAGLIAGGNDAEAGVPLAEGNLLDGATDPDGDTLTIAGVGQGGVAGTVGEEFQGMFGTLLVNPDGTYVYTLDNDRAETQALGADDSVTEVFSFIVSDGSEDTVSATLTITIQGTNDLPVISGVDQGAVEENGVSSASGQLVVSDVDTGDTHTWSAPDGTGGTYGSFTLSPSGEWVYTLGAGDPAVEALGVGDTLTDQMLVRVTDSYGSFTEQLVTVTITGANDAPVIDPDTSELDGLVTELPDLSTGENATVLTTTGTIEFSDPDLSDVPPMVTVAPVGDGSDFLGEISVGTATDGSVDWTFTVDDALLDSLPEGTTLTQSYEVTLTDEHGATVTETVTVTIVGTNDAPEPEDDSSLIAVGETAVLDVLANDTDVDDGQAATPSVTEVDGQPISVGNPVTLGDGSGTLSIGPDGVLSFEPAPGVTGPVAIPYTVDDGTGTPNATSVGEWVVTVVGVTIIDDAAPGAPDTPDDVLSTLDDLEAVEVTGEISEGGTITEVTLSDGTTTVTVPTDDVTLNPDGTFTLPVDVTDLLDGTLTVTVTQEDPDGNTATTSDTIVKDTVTSVSIDPVTVIDGQVPTLTGTALPDDTLTLTIDGIGTVTVPVQPDGTWSYTPPNPLDTPEITVVATATDPNGNTATDERDVASLGGASVLVSESGLPTGTQPASGSDSTTQTQIIGTSEDTITEVVIAGTTLTVAQLLDAGTTPIAPITTTLGTLTVTSYDPATGKLGDTFTTQTNSLDNENTVGVPSEADLLTETIDISVVDGDGDTRVTTLDISVSDDTPLVGINPASTATLTSSDATLGVDPSQSFADLFDINPGADGPAASDPVVYALDIPSAGVPSGLVDAATGDPINLYLESGEIVGRVGPATGPVAITFAVDPATGVITLDQERPVQHPDGATTNAVTLTNTAVILSATVTGGDGDIVTQTVRIGDRLGVADDVAAAVDETPLTTVEGGVTLGTANGDANLLANDTLGADGATLHQVQYVDDAGVTQTVTLSGGTTGPLDTQYGTLTVIADGSWSFAPDAAAEHTGGTPLVADFGYALIDSDGDVTSFATQPITVADTGPVAVDDAAIVIAETAANATGNVITNDTASADGGTAINSFTYTDASGAPATFTFTEGGPTTSTVTTPTGDLTVNTDGSWSFDPSGSFDHDAPGADPAAGGFTYVLVDADGTLSSEASQHITVTDTDPASGAVSFGLDEADLPGGSAAGASDPTVTEALTIVPGGDPIADVVFTADTVSGLPALSSGGYAAGLYRVARRAHADRDHRGRRGHGLHPRDRQPDRCDGCHAIHHGHALGPD